ncbi:uncharacterized protein LOC111021388 isoform X2 [Momordica charantia]|uniref:Uncharacterized protein LOC111021388 isoform X2 n=1 Tax=Momordica charantia TaxID=3673 RepID=A0A6J1DKV3_MOMCH|nr:uncharacterized protein LOC111021388 isoform X2 [Momordica charantia]
MKQSLLFYENLTPPLVIVINANMGCNRCRQRVSQLLSKMSELIEVTIDVTKNQVVVKGNIKFQSKKEEINVHYSQVKGGSLKSISLELSNHCF